MRFLYLVVFALLIFSCKQKPSENLHSENVIAPILFPITEIIEGDIYNAEHLPVTPLEKINVNNQTDSFWRKREEIRNWAAPFLSPALDSISLSKYFIEKSFLDKTIDAFTIIYERKEDEAKQIPWKICNLYIDPKANKVEKIYLVKDTILDGQSASLQLTWTINNKALIRTLVPKTNGQFDIREKQLSWGIQ